MGPYGTLMLIALAGLFVAPMLTGLVAYWVTRSNRGVALWTLGVLIVALLIGAKSPTIAGLLGSLPLVLAWFAGSMLAWRELRRVRRG